ncbi:hypothetical protein Q9R29_09140 [Rothia sp. ARF10]|nr:hypothetical protein [Rothia sp. ARF10]
MSLTSPARMPAGVLLRQTADRRRLGESPGDREADGRAKWVRVRHGVVVRRDVWAGLDSTQRHDAFVRSTAMQMRAAEHLVFSHTSAAAIWGLPRITPWPHRASVTSDRPTARSSGLVRRHIGEVDERVTLDGLTITTVARTVIDLAE